MKLIYKMLISICLMAVSGYVLALAPPVTAHVTYVGTYGSGRIFVGIDKTISEPGCAASRFDVISTHTQDDHWLNIATQAHVTGKPIVVRTNGCYDGRPTLDKTTSSYFYIN